MKKFLQFLGGAVVAASVIPYSYAKDQESGDQTVQALLWKASLRSQPEAGEKKLTLTFGFHNPFPASTEALPEDEAELFADEELAGDCSCETPCCCGTCQESAPEAEDAPAQTDEPCCPEGPCCEECCQGCCDETAEDAADETDTQT